MVRNLALACFTALFSTTVAIAQAPQQPPLGAAPPQGKPAESPKPAVKPGQPKPYKDVITAEAKSDPGLFTVHKIDEKYYFEIPESELGKDMLYQTEIAKVPAGLGFGGTAAGHRVVRWTRRNNKVYLRGADYQIRSESDGGIRRAVESASLEPIIMSFDVEAEGPNKSAVIDVTRLVGTDVPEFSAKWRLAGATGVDPSRSYIESVKSFPSNIEMKTMLTFNMGPQPFNIFRRRPGTEPARFNGSSATTLIHYSMVKLPEKQMMGRLFDSRVGYFAERFLEFGGPENRVQDLEYISRYRLEKKDPSLAVSEPVKPIVYYVSREVPEKWRPYIKKGIEDWQPAFEKAGFKNAIIAKDAPSLEQEPNWDPEDARYSVVRWAPDPTENAQGPHVHDPRSGEIISAHIIVWHDVLKLAETWYFVQVGPLDRRAQRLPLPEPLMGDLIRYVVAHEVGHTLGLRHNHKASSSYTCAQLRSKQFTEKYGNEASIMDYGRFNYVAQPGDNARLIPLLGPYDYFAIEWGYTPVLSARTPDDEKHYLDQVAARQVGNPMLRFGGENEQSLVDPTVQTEDLGSDPIEATTYGLKNIARVARMLIPATTRYGENYKLLNETYDSLLGQRRMELSHVLKLVGGIVETDYHSGRGDEVFKPVPGSRQKQAVKFLVDNAFATPRELLIPAILSKIQMTGAADQVLASQRSIMNGLLSEPRAKRMQEIAANTPVGAYTVSQMVQDVQDGIWGELAQPKPAIDLYRRNLQRAYLEQYKQLLTGDSPTSTDLRPLGRGALRKLAVAIDKAIPRSADSITALHLEDCRKNIERILNPKS